MFEFKSDDRLRQQIINRLFQLRLVAAVNSAITSFLLFTAWNAGALSLWSAAAAGEGHVTFKSPLNSIIDYYSIITQW